MIRHIVLLNLVQGFEPRELESVMERLASLVGDISGFVAFSHGPNRDYENKSVDYPYGFVCDFTDRAALEAYANDPRHQALGARLVTLCTGGAAGIFVADIET